jgi:hypothetical protein
MEPRGAPPRCGSTFDPPGRRTIEATPTKR